MSRCHRLASDADRERMIKRYEQGEDFLTTANGLGINRTTAYAVIRQYQRQLAEPLAEARRPGRQKLLDDESIDLLVMLVDGNVTITVKDLNRSLREVFPRKRQVSDATVSRALECELFTVKLCANIPVERNSERTKQARVTYAHNAYNRGINRDKVYIDEMGFNMYTKRSYGRARLGERAQRIVGGQRGNNLTMIAAISDQAGLFYYEIFTTDAKQQHFVNFVTSLDVIMGENFNPYIILDNCSIHNRIQDTFPHRRFTYLPPYSPFLNPIEECFSVVKSRVKNLLNDDVENCTRARARREGVTLVALRERILEAHLRVAITAITPELCSRLYHQANTYLMKCLNNDDIWH